MSRWWKAASWAPGGTMTTTLPDHSLSLFFAPVFSAAKPRDRGPKGASTARPTLPTLKPCTLFGEKRLACWASAAFATHIGHTFARLFHIRVCPPGGAMCAIRKPPFRCLLLSLSGTVITPHVAISA